MRQVLYRRNSSIMLLAVGRKRNMEYLANCKRPPLALELEYKIINKTILSIGA